MKTINLRNLKNQINNIKLKTQSFIENTIDKRQKICLLTGVFLSALSLIFAKTVFVNNNEIKRNPYGAKDSEYTLNITDKKGINDEIKFTVSSRRYTIDEANETFDKLFLKLPEYILEDNHSLDDIRSDLKLNNYIRKEGIYVDYLFKLDASYDDESHEKYRNILSVDGKVNNEMFSEDETISGSLKVIFSCYISNTNIRYSSDPYILPLKIKSKKLTISERLKSNLLKQIIEADKSTIEKPTIILPNNISGTDIKINYSEKQNYTFLLLFAITILIAILLPLKDKSKKDEAEKHRLKILQKEYYPFVTKLAIYIGAGETIKNALTRIHNLFTKKTKKDDSPLNDELEISLRKMDNGVSEDVALSELSNKIGLRQYTKLFNILEQNRKSGSGDIKVSLFNELDDAFNERKLNAKILGEEAQTKLIFPLIMMLAIILVIIMVPAITGI